MWAAEQISAIATLSTEVGQVKCSSPRHQILKKSSSKYILSRDKSRSSVWYSVIRPLGREMSQTQADMAVGGSF
jgi:hypothetical protein